MSGSIDARLQQVRVRIDAACRSANREPGEVGLVAVSKRHPAAAVLAAQAAGQRVFGENRVQELAAKAIELQGAELEWHFIGSLQTNKVRELLAVEGLTLLHSMDRRKLADELHKELERIDRKLAVLLQVHATDEPSKHGCPPEQVAALLRHVVEQCPRLEVRGLMAMGPLEGDPKPVFAAVASLRAELQKATGLPLPVLSLGMSGDLELAVAAGSTMVRIGTAVFGQRLIR